MQTPHTTLWFGTTPDHTSPKSVRGEYVHLLGEAYYKITNYDALPPFFMSIVSDSDLWLFISSTGGLSAGRRNAESALFPYYTEDKLTENAENTGSRTILRIAREGKLLLWEPFSVRYAGIYQAQRNLYKNVYGNALIFEEINQDLQLTFRYAWRSSDRYGWVRTAWLSNEAAEPCVIDILDGLQNILPYGATSQMQNTFSVLMDAYKRHELESSSGLGMFTLSSILTDLAEPSEALKATTVWQVGLDQPQYLLSARQIDNFRHGGDVQTETDLRGGRNAFFVNARLNLAANVEQMWHIVAEVNQDHTQVTALINALQRDRAALCRDVEADIRRGTENLMTIIARADGLQTSADELSTAHHFANALFNTMRGGIFADQYQVSKVDLLDFVHTRNRSVLQVYQAFFTSLPEKFTITTLLQQAAATGAADVERLCHEYLPLTFSRRHGDPSRPWNVFSINLKNDDGSQRLDYQGNWRDIFQNWEPLAHSYPEFAESLICKFLNATTPDGYNPYRITRDGIEWEVPEPGHPWANIGYWSDHQIIYLQKLLEISAKFHPGRLNAMLNHRMFSSANVPYKLKPYQNLLDDWYATIEFDHAQHQAIQQRVRQIGTDGKLVYNAQGQVLHVSLTEKLLILLLAKLSNLAPEGGIWMNTQRPEWNDANNALVGKGLSMVTVYYLRRFITFYADLLRTTEISTFTLTREGSEWLNALAAILTQYQSVLTGACRDADRRAVMDAFGQAASDYRWTYYQQGFSGEWAEVDKHAVITFLDATGACLEQTIRANKRPDHLYHAYNVLQLGAQTAAVRNLYEMLEGQVAVLSSGLLTPQEALTLLQALRASRMYRADQHSYTLYPDRELPGFLRKNSIPAESVKDLPLVAQLIADQNTSLILRDENGDYHFNGSFRNAKDVQRVLDALKTQPAYAALVEQDTQRILNLFEEIFDHNSFTGRSGTFFGYEGLGSIYWHMVSKLLLAVQEIYFQAVAHGEPETVIQQLAERYYDIRSGLGFNKTPEVYGAFPTDPYSHTPAGQGAKQPGMTGQVKEELLTRLGEMGLIVQNGVIYFTPGLLRAQELTTSAQIFTYRDLTGQPQTIQLEPGSLAYTFCQTPIVYRAFASEKIVVALTDGTQREIAGNQLDAELSQHIFRRDGFIRQVTVHIKK